MNNTPQLKNFSILIAEDEKSNFEYLSLLLRKAEAEVHWAKDGEEAVARFRELPNLNLILMDIRMPKLNGLLATKQIRELGTDIPIIAQTAYATSEDIAQAMKHGCTDFLTKPIGVRTFYNKIIQYLS